MEPDKNKDITQQMAEKLRKHSLPYEEGAWERFKDYELLHKRNVVLWPYFSGAAAAILLAVILFWTNGRKESINESQIAKTELPDEKIQELKKEEIESKSLTSAKSATFSGQLNNSLEIAILEKKDDSFQPTQSTTLKVDKKVGTQNSLSLNEVRITNLRQNSMNNPETSRSLLEDENKPEKRIQPFAINPKDAFSNKNALIADSYKEKVDHEQSLNKWNFSLELSPNIKDKNVNFGGGVAIAYNITNKISISSGISYMQLDAERGFNHDGSSELSRASINSYNYTKSLNTINTSLVGLDIPINLKLNLNNKVYASAGVSVFSVLNETRYNNFEEQVAVLSYSTTDKGSLKKPEPLVQTVYSQEESEITPYQGKNFTGFFNFSVGYKLPIFKKFGLAIEPYLKVPIGNLSDQDMNLSNGGIKIITSF